MVDLTRSPFERTAFGRQGPEVRILSPRSFIFSHFNDLARCANSRASRLPLVVTRVSQGASEWRIFSGAMGVTKSRSDNAIFPPKSKHSRVTLMPSAGDPSPLNWSTGIVSKRRIELWESRDTSPKRLSRSCARLKYWSAN